MDKAVNRTLNLLAMLMLVLSMALVAQAENSTYPLELTDSTGRNITIQVPVQRILVQNNYCVDALRILGDLDKVVGVVDTTHARPELYPELKDKQVVGLWNSPDFEMIGEMAKKGTDAIYPDIIVLCFDYGTSGGKSYGVDMFTKGLAPFKNITVVGLDFTNAENVTKSMTTLGRIMNKEKEADAYNRWYEEKLSQIEASVKGRPIKKVFLEAQSSAGTGDITAYVSGSGFGRLVSLAGGYNIARPGKDIPMVSSSTCKVTWEWVVTQKPDVILKLQAPTTLGWNKGPSTDTVNLETVRNEVLGRVGGSAIPAIKNKNVFLCYSGMTYGLYNVVGQAYIAKAIYPDADIDPMEMWNEYQNLIGPDYPKDRIFIYPEQS